MKLYALFAIMLLLVGSLHALPWTKSDTYYSSLFCKLTGCNVSNLEISNGLTVHSTSYLNTTIVTSSSTSPFVIYRYADDTTGANFGNSRARGTVELPTILQNSDNTGGIVANGYDGATMRNLGALRFYVDGTPGAGDMPGRLLISLTPDGSSSLAGVMQIDNGGQVSMGKAIIGADFDETLYIGSNTQVGGNISYNLLIGNGDNTIGDEVGIRMKAASAPGANRAKGLFAYKSTATYGRGSFLWYQDTAEDASPVLNTDTLAMSLDTNSNLNVTGNITAEGISLSTDSACTITSNGSLMNMSCGGSWLAIGN